MERPFTLQWARQSAGATQDPADGSSLIDTYAVNPAALPSAPNQPKVAVELTPAPSLSEYLALPALMNFNWTHPDRGAQTADAVINAVTTIDHPSYGQRLVGVCAGVWFFEIPFDGGAGNPAANYDGRGTLHSQAFATANFTRFKDADLDTEELLGTDPTRLATDGRRVLFVTRSHALVYDADDSSFKIAHAPHSGQPERYAAR